MLAERRAFRRLARVSAQLARPAAGDAVVPELFGAQRGGRSVDEAHGNLYSDFPAPGRPPPPTPVPGYLAHTAPSAAQLAAWVEQFHTEGFLYLPSVLPPALCAQLRSDLDWALANSGEAGGHFPPRMFELSAANLS